MIESTEFLDTGLAQDSPATLGVIAFECTYVVRWVLDSYEVKLYKKGVHDCIKNIVRLVRPKFDIHCYDF